MISIVDYGVGNLFSLSASLKHLDIPHVITNNAEEIQAASHLILPGVGAFGDASALLFASGMAEIVVKESQNKPLLGICVGMQLLFDKSYEFGEHKGLGLIEGAVHPIKESMNQPLKVPHMGWNKLNIQQKSPILKYLSPSDYVYFVHSYGAKTKAEYLTSTANYAMEITATVAKGSVYGCQFHPEKSGEVGLKILKAFYEI